jgi:HEAT repeat protein
MPFKEPIMHLVAVDDYKVWQGLAGFEILGPEAAPAVPDLARLLPASSSRWWSRKDAAFLALAAIGRAGLPPLLTALADPTSHNRVETIAHFRSFNLGTNGWFAAPVLITCVSDRDSQVAEAATWALTDLGLPQETVLPAIKMAVLDHRWNVRHVAVQALGRLGTQGVPCMELLTNCYNDPDPRVTAAATNAFNRIAEDACAKTESQDLR